jgi:hypothetical protein
MIKGKAIVIGLFLSVIFLITSYSYNLSGRFSYSHSTVESKIRRVFEESYVPDVSILSIGDFEIVIKQTFLENSWSHGSFVWITNRQQSVMKNQQLVIKMSDSELFTSWDFISSYKITDQNGVRFHYGGAGMFSAQNIDNFNKDNFVLVIKRLRKDSLDFEKTISFKRESSIAQPNKDSF